MTTEAHIHRWLLSSPNGKEYVEGECACGATRQDKAGYDDSGHATWRRCKRCGKSVANPEHLEGCPA